MRRTEAVTAKRPALPLLPLISLLLLILVIASLLSLAYGPVVLAPDRLVEAIVQPDSGSLEARILYTVRLPRTVATLVAGMALAVSGAILQTLLNNALAGPNIIGVNAGAGFATLLILAFLPQFFALIPLASFIGSVATTLFIFWLAQRTGASRLTIILAGIAIGTFLTAATEAILLLSPDKTLAVTSFMLGSFAGVTLARVGVALPSILLVLTAAMLLSRSLSVLSLGDETAQSLGLNVRRHRLLWIVFAATLAGGAVSFAGLLGFVGLVAPHVARQLLGHRPTGLLPVSALLGGIFVTCCDWLSRLVFAPYELPVGIMMAFLGSPFFISLLLQKKRGRLNG